MICFAIFAAVSTVKQAREVSLGEQERLAREEANKRGWQETAGPFVIPGKSRTEYVSLRDAERGLPELSAMLESAKRGEFDVCACYSFDRFRDLLSQVSKSLLAYKVQMFSVTQPSEIAQPEEFNPNRDGTNEAMRTLFELQSKGEISALRNRYLLGMPKRILESGLPPSRLPYGYRKPLGLEEVSKVIPVQDSARAVWVVRMKDLFLAGQSSTAICDYLNSQGVKPMNSEQWRPSSVLTILANPFYSGVVRFSNLKYFHDPRAEGKGRNYTHPNPTPVIAEGKHEPLWDKNSQHAIEQEFKRRREAFWKGPHKTHPLSSLCYCGYCGARLNANTNGPRRNGEHTLVYRCKNSTRPTRSQHITIERGEAHRQVGEELARVLRETVDYSTLLPQANEGHQDQVNNALADLSDRRHRIEEAYESGVYPLASFSEKAAAIDRQTAELRAQLAGSEQAKMSKKRFMETAESLANDLDTLPEWIAEDDPAIVNNILSRLLVKATFYDNNPPVFEFR